MICIAMLMAASFLGLVLGAFFAVAMVANIIGFAKNHIEFPPLLIVLALALSWAFLSLGLWAGLVVVRML